MKLEELKKRLLDEKFDPRFFSLDGSNPIEGFVLREANRRWRIDYFERGETRNLADFESLFDACDYFYSRIDRELRPKSKA